MSLDNYYRVPPKFLISELKGVPERMNVYHEAVGYKL